MKSTRFLPSLLALMACAAGLRPVSAQVLPTRILPLGDSITYGSPVAGGYRARLYQLLTTAGYNVDFVGTQTANGVAGLPDSDHEGHGGWRIDQLDTNILTWFNSFASPDVILLHIGTNDFGQNNDITNAVHRLDALVTKMALAKPDAHIIVSNLMQRGEPHDTRIQNLFNPYVEAKVDAQVALGRHVTFLDMRSAVPLADMPDNLHPNQTGYNKMADAWLPAIQAVVTPQTDTTPPSLTGAVGNLARTQVAVSFSKPVADGATNTVNYAIDGGVSVLGATIDAPKRVVTLTTSTQTMGATYTITVNNITDRTDPTPIAIMPDSTITFVGARPRGYENNVPASAGYTLVHSIDLPTAANYSAGPVPYALDRSATIGPFSRIAYYLELQKADGILQYAWASMDAFTADPGRIGIPALFTQAIFQQPVTNLHVFSNVAGVNTGTNLTGNLEFWPTNYQAANGAGVSGASASAYDFGDNRTAGNYGSFQIHNTGDSQTVIAFNRWGGGGGNADLGIGNRPGSNDTDWTFAQNAADYTIKTLQVLVYTGDDAAPPSALSAQASYGRTQVVVRFSEPLAAASVLASGFSLDQGVSVQGVSLSADQRVVTLLTTIQPEGTPLTLTLNGVRDASPCANRIADGTTLPVSTSALPPEIAANVGAAANGYALVCSADLPVRGNFNSSAAYSFDDRGAPGTFDRVAYYLELQKPGGPVQYVWTSMDAFTPTRARVGYPTLASGAVFQQNVSNLDVVSNVAGISNGVSMADGNIEFWPTDYSVANALSVPNGSATTYDVGDTRSTTGSHGSMQVHNHATGATQTLFGINNWGADGNVLGLGIGNNPTPVSNGVDWTHSANAASYTRRRLHVLVRPSAPPANVPSEVLANVPDATNYVHVATLNIPASGHNASATYTNDIRGTLGPFSRVGYYFQLGKGATTNWVWTSMDAFTANPQHIGLPTAASGGNFQRKVSNLDVLSNVPGVVNGTGLAGGNIEFWPGNYTGANGLAIPGASASAFDFGDTMTAGSHGCMQVHNHLAGQTLFAFNNWGAGSPATNSFALGIGNQPTSHPDWTFAANGASYSNRVLHIFVQLGYGDSNPPVLTGASASATLDRLTVSFSRALADSAADPALYTIPGLTVTGASLSASLRDVILTTSPQTPGTVYTVTVAGVQDRNAYGLPVTPGSSTTFTAYQESAVLGQVPESVDYRLLFRLPIPNAATYNTAPVPYTIDEGKYPQYETYDRIAYLLELQTASTSQWVYASMDAFTPMVSRMGVPTTASGAVFQQLVSNLNVYSSPGSGITNGTGLATGNIEFWPTNYSAPNANSVPGTTSTTLYDWGDTRTTTGTYGSMQVHNHGSLQTLFAYNNWGGSGGNSALGVGNDPAPVTNGLDWTFHQNAATYTVKNLFVLGRPAPASSAGAPVLVTSPIPRTVNAGEAACFAVNASGASPLRYQWRRNGTPLVGQTDPWLDVNPASVGDAGDYDVIVTAVGGGAVTSPIATLTVIETNHAPTFPGYAVTTGQNTSKAISMAALENKGEDVDGDPLQLTGSDTASQQGGSITADASNLVFAPANGFSGADSFAITLADGRGGLVTGVVAVTVTTLDTTPAQDSAIEVRAGGQTSVLFLGTPGQSYEIQRATTLSPADWTTIATLTAGDDGILVFTDPSPASPRSYYRSKTSP